MEKVSYKLFLFLLVFSPLAFGTTELWSLTIVELFALAATILLITHRLINKKEIYTVPGILPLLIFLFYILFHLIPLPEVIVKLLSSNTNEIYKQSIGLIDDGMWQSLSINKKNTLSELFRYSAYVCFYFLTVQLLANKKKLEQTIKIVVAFSSLLSVLAILQYYSSKDMIYWFRAVPNNSIIFGPYVNHNHFAGLIEMILPIAVALFLCLKPNVSYKVSFKEKLIGLIDPQRLESHILLGFSAVILAIAIIVSVSRGAFISVSLSMAFFISILFLKNKKKKGGMLIALFCIVIVLSINWFSWDKISDRFEELESESGEIYEARLVFWKDSIDIIKTYPLTGIGFGNFGEIYPRHRTFLSKNRLVLHAHNDYLELLIEGGLIAFFLVGWFLYSLLIPNLKAIAQRKEQYSIYLFWGCLTGIIAIFIHSLVDFNTHIGANGLYLFFLFGLLVSAANTRLRGLKAKTKLFTLNSQQLKYAIPIISMLIISNLIFNIGIIGSEFYFNKVDDIFLDENTSKKTIKNLQSDVNVASVFDPLEGQYYFAKANLISLLDDRKEAISNYKKAVYYNPTRGEYLQQAGLYLDNIGGYNGEKLIQAGIKADITNTDAYGVYASWLLFQGRKEDCMIILSKALSIYPEIANEYISLMLMNDFKLEEMFKVIPEKASSYIDLGSYLFQAKDYESAETSFIKALSLLGTDGNLKAVDFIRAAHFYVSTKKLDQAINILLQGVDYFPNDIDLRLKIADLYLKRGISYRAKEEFKKVLMLDPKNEVAIQLLRTKF